MTFSLKTGNIDKTSFPLVFHVIRIASKYILAIFVYFAKKFTSESILFFNFSIFWHKFSSYHN